jgi:hypothetical protein
MGVPHRNNRSAGMLGVCRPAWRIFPEGACDGVGSEPLGYSTEPAWLRHRMRSGLRDIRDHQPLRWDAGDMPTSRAAFPEGTRGRMGGERLGRPTE